MRRHISFWLEGCLGGYVSYNCDCGVFFVLPGGGVGGTYLAISLAVNISLFN
jgi:hypothetical protein